MVGDFIMKKKEMKDFVWKETTCASYKKNESEWLCEEIKMKKGRI